MDLTNRRTRDRAPLLIGFAAALRRSELVRIDVEHLTFRPEGLALTFSSSKTDQAEDDIDLAVPAIPLSRYCPVAALNVWLAISGLTKGAVFRRLRRGYITTAARNRADVFAIAAQSRHRSLDTVREYVDAETRFDDHPGLKMFQ